MILPLFDYADFMIESARKYKIKKMEKLQEKGLRYIDNDFHFKVDVDVLYTRYIKKKVTMRHKEHYGLYNV